jgi:hypothetical protein
VRTRATHITLRLVKCGPGVPTASEEAAAVKLDDPSLTLAAAGVNGTAWMLAKVAGARVGLRSSGTAPEAPSLPTCWTQAY